MTSHIIAKPGTSGGGSGGSVNSVNGVGPDETGNVDIFIPTSFNGIDFTFIAGSALSAHKVVASSSSGLVYADKDTLTQQLKIVGITTSSTAASGESITVRPNGYLSDSSFTFTEGPIFLGNSGAIVQTIPTTGIYLQLGVALNATTILIEIGEGIKRG